MNDTELIVEPGRQDIVLIRTFDAPKDVVFRVYTDPNLISRWWGPRSLSTEVDHADIRTGGRWRFINRDAEGNEYSFNGVYHDVTAPDRIVHTFEFEGAPGHALLETVTFEEVDGRTKLTDQSVFQSVGDRDAMVEHGMEVGARESMDRLAELLADRTAANLG